MSSWCQRSEENGQTGLSWQKGKVTQIVRTEVCRRASLNSQHVELWGRWATAAEKHTECHSCQLRTRNWGYNSHGSPKLDNRRLEKHCLGLMSLDFCCNSQTVGSKFGINNIKASIRTALHQWSCWWWCNGLWDILLVHVVGPFVPCQSLYTFIQYTHLLLATSNTGFLNMKMSSLYSNDLHSHQI